MNQEQTRFRLTIPLRDAFAFAMGWSDLGYESPSDAMRQVLGLLVVDCRAMACLRPGTCLSQRKMARVLLLA
jgi:hypothetical protein